jgi:hypothetical protein
MLDASAAVRDGKAKACIFVATSATAQSDAVPLWLENAPGALTWKDGYNQVHVRMDKTAGWQAMADFLVAVTKKYGGDPRVASITHAEYYPTSTVPTDFNLSVFKSNAKLMRRDWVDAAPRNEGGERVTLVQTNPYVNGPEVEASDLQALGMGISGSGAEIFTPTAGDEARRALYGVVPLQHQVNAGSVGAPVTFDGTPNPFGIAAGQTVNTQHQHIAWYYSSKEEGTKIPLDSLMMGDRATLIAQWHEAYGKFEPNGSLAEQHGQIPNRPGGSP